jgi:hypothetical protein
MISYKKYPRSCLEKCPLLCCISVKLGKSLFQTERCYSLKDGYLHSHRSDNIESNTDYVNLVYDNLKDSGRR